jgi:hypothetical protein
MPPSVDTKMMPDKVNALMNAAKLAWTAQLFL